MPEKIYKKYGSMEWSEVEGEKFEPGEARDASDFADQMNHWQIEPEYLKDYIGSQELRVGQRLFLAEYLPIDDVGVVLMGDEDMRIVNVAKTRCRDQNKGDRTIWLPGDAE